jgi:E3 ubiquitin-protein ligase synoviolin
METCLAMTIFREEFNVHFVVLFVALLFVKMGHWLAQDR